MPQTVKRRWHERPRIPKMDAVPTEVKKRIFFARIEAKKTVETRKNYLLGKALEAFEKEVNVLGRKKKAAIMRVYEKLGALALSKQFASARLENAARARDEMRLRPPENPETRKQVEKIIGHQQAMQEYINAKQDALQKDLERLFGGKEKYWLFTEIVGDVRKQEQM